MEFNGNNNSNNNKSSQNNSGLLRYRSAPTPLLSNFTSLSPGFCSDDDQTISPVVHVMKTNDDDDDDDDNGGCNKGFGCVKPPQYPRQNGLLSSFNYERLETNMGSGRYRVADGDANGDLLSTSSSRLKMLSQIMEAEYENLDGHRTEHINRENLFSGFGSWNDDSSYYAENFVTSGVIKREMDDDRTVFVDTKNVETGNSIGATDKLLRFQDTVPCKFRAKRGCATHPRSIAERVRRTKISERMRKLQELVPNMDKQTNTADMLDLAVEYVKSLQKQYKTLSNIRANCKCSASEKMYLN